MEKRVVRSNIKHTTTFSPGDQNILPYYVAQSVTT
jgi:hypothetical protein